MLRSSGASVRRSGHWRRPESFRIVDAALQLGIAAVFVAGVRRLNPSVVVNACLSAVFALLPGVLERSHGVPFRPGQRLWISTAALVHAVGMLGPYDRIWWWDHLAHTLTGVVVAGTADVYFQRVVAGAVDAPDRGRVRAWFVVGATLGFGLFWELVEYVIHVLARRVGFEPLLVHYGRFDTAADLLFDVLGAGLVVAFGRVALADVADEMPGE